MNRYWLTWNDSQRSRSLAELLDCRLQGAFYEPPFMVRHLVCALHTVFILIKYRPVHIAIQYSFLLLVVLAIYKSVFRRRAKILCDCHTKALRRSISGLFGRVFARLKSWSFKSVDVALVANEGMIGDISKYCDRYMVVPDPIPNIKKVSRYNDDYLIFVCAFAVDEPIAEFFSAASKLPDYEFKCTGRPSREVSTMNVPENVELVGFLPREEYLHLINGAECVIALTTEENCVQCAAYESISCELPMVISDGVEARDIFKDAAVYVENSGDAIAEGIRLALDNRSKMIEYSKVVKREIEGEQARIKKEIEQEWLN